MEGEYLFKDLSYKLVGLCMELHREYGRFHNERIYHKGLEEKLEGSRIEFKSKPRIAVYSKYSGKEIGYYEPDLLVDNKIIVELKVYPKIIRKHEIQLLEYLKTSEYELGYLFNFGLQSLYFRRVIFTNNNKLFMIKVKPK